MARVVFLLLLLIWCLFPAPAQITDERLLRAAETPADWLMYSGDYSAQRHSRLAQINTANVRDLTAQWVFQTGVAGQFETVPLVYDALMYFTTAKNEVYALDARTGRPIWQYQHPLPEQIIGAKVNRGLAAHGHKVFMATLDGRVVALDSKTGNVVWNVKTEGSHPATSFTVAPLAVRGKIIVGVSGGDYGLRGFIDAYDADTGRRVWRFQTVPGPGEPGHETWAGDSWKQGGAPGWLTGSFDPKLNMIYWTTGNPAPDHDGRLRAGDNLYSCSVVALDADSGQLKWHFQFTPHDVHDWDANQIPVLLDLDYQGRARQLLALANRNGFFYLLDRTNGKFLFAKPFARVTWANEIGSDGRPVRLPNTSPTLEGTFVCPGIAGATNWFSPAFNPQTKLFYVLVREQCDTYFLSPQEYKEGQYYSAGSTIGNPLEKEWGALRALDPLTGEKRWEFRYYTAPWTPGTLSTAGGLVFAADNEGYFMAFAAATGKLLWRFQTGANISASPITYAIGNRQYVAMPSGSALFTFALPESATAGGIAERTPNRRHRARISRRQMLRQKLR